jgi:hypothetical protein
MKVVLVPAQGFEGLEGVRIIDVLGCVPARVCPREVPIR